MKHNGQSLNWYVLDDRDQVLDFSDLWNAMSEYIVLLSKQEKKNFKKKKENSSNLWIVTAKNKQQEKDKKNSEISFKWGGAQQLPNESKCSYSSARVEYHAKSPTKECIDNDAHFAREAQIKQTRNLTINQ